VTGRRILELVGTQGYRAAYPDVWVDLALAGGGPAVFDDVRFPNEAEGIRKRGGVIVAVEAIGAPVRRTGHESDEAWRSIMPDYRITAKFGDMARLLSQADTLVSVLEAARG
jgi:RNA-splicing ligase RtcB